MLPIFFTGFLLGVPQIVFAASQDSKEMWETIFVSWFPMLLLIGVWIYFMRKMRGKGQTWSAEQTNQHLEKIGQSLERIAKALEKKWNISTICFQRTAPIGSTRIMLVPKTNLTRSYSPFSIFLMATLGPPPGVVLVALPA
jgi:Na+/H+ antiporter NhaC